MSRILSLKADLLQKRKDRDADAVALLSPLYSEAAMVGKNNGDRETTDDEVIALIKKFLKNAEETRGHLSAGLPNTADRLVTVDREISILKAYLPQQMTTDELQQAVTAILAANPGANMGAVMAALKASYGGSYDGKTAGAIVKAALAA